MKDFNLPQALKLQVLITPLNLAWTASIVRGKNFFSVLRNQKWQSPSTTSKAALKGFTRI